MRTAIGRLPIALALVASGFALSPPLIRANGGVFNSSAVQRTGNLVPLQKESISLDRENLAIRFERDTAFVKVDYELVNHQGGDEVIFGFPVDLFTPETLEAVNGYDYVLSQSFGDFQVSDNDVRLTVEKTVDKPLGPDERPPGLDGKIQLVRRWSLVQLTFRPGERKRVTVSYRVTCIAKDYGFSERGWDWKFGERSFFYTFRPASTWGDGRVRELNISVDAKWLRERGVPITRTEPTGYVDEEGTMHWHFRNQKLSDLPDMRVGYNPAELYSNEAITKDLVPKEKMRTLDVSSNLPSAGGHRYSEQSMLDRDLDTAWVEGAKGAGIGESIVFTPPKKTYVESIGILNGYAVDRRLYYANGRIKKLRVEVDVGEGAEPNERHRVKDVTLPDRPYEQLNRRYPLPSIDWVLNHGQGGGFIDRVRFTILEVYPGTDYEDTAITEFYVCGFPVK